MQEALDDCETLKEGWPSQVLTMQENWIGRSEGLEFSFELSAESKVKLGGNFDKYAVFTTRPDTIYGVSYSARLPEHAIVKYRLKVAFKRKIKITQIKKMPSVGSRERAQLLKKVLV